MSNQAALWRVVDLRANFTSRDSFKYLLADDIFQVKAGHALPDIHARNVQISRYEEGHNSDSRTCSRPLTTCPGQALGRKGGMSSFSGTQVDFFQEFTVARGQVSRSFRRKPESRFVHLIKT